MPENPLVGTPQAALLPYFSAYSYSRPLLRPALLDNDWTSCSPLMKEEELEETPLVETLLVALPLQLFSHPFLDSLG